MQERDCRTPEQPTENDALADDELLEIADALFVELDWVENGVGDQPGQSESL